MVDTTLARRVLTALGLAAEPASSAPARDPPQSEFAWDDPASSCAHEFLLRYPGEPA